MTLKIAEDSGLTNIVSTDGTNPITTQHPISGSAVEKQVWLFNDDNTKYYSGITVTPYDTNASGGGTISEIQLAPDNAGVAGTYGAAGAALSMADIGSSGAPNTTGHPFWYKITTPSVASSQNMTDLALDVAATEFAV